MNKEDILKLVEQTFNEEVYATHGYGEGPYVMGFDRFFDILSQRLEKLIDISK